MSGCPGCGLPEDYCACGDTCNDVPPLQIALLLHENEPARPSNTSRLIAQLLPEVTHTFIWQRTAPPEKLIGMLNDPRYQPWLLFPADRPELEPRANTYQATEGKIPLIVVPDGTWKEVRKIVRKSPWLNELPLLAFDPDRRTRYTLRRNPDDDHLCTAETVAEVLRLADADGAASALDQLLDRFLIHYHAWKCNHPIPDNSV